jgi:hypothetical protein
MRAFNQTKNRLGWSMAGVRYECEPWESVELKDPLYAAARKLGIPLDVAPVAPELRAAVRIAEERQASQEAPLHALKALADSAQASERAAKEELGRLSVELSQARSDLREANERLVRMRDELARIKADREAAEALVSETAAQATAAEERAIKAEALHAESKPKGRPRHGEGT